MIEARNLKAEGGNMYNKKQRSIRLARHPPFRFKQMITFFIRTDKRSEKKGERYERQKFQSVIR